jgi:hypothetical protein
MTNKKQTKNSIDCTALERWYNLSFYRLLFGSLFICNFFLLFLNYVFESHELKKKIWRLESGQKMKQVY